MVTDNLMALMSLEAPPNSDEQAAERISEFGSETMTNLIGLRFHDFRQFQRACASIRHSATGKKILDNGYVRTYKIELQSSSGTFYRIFGTEIGDHMFRIDNVKAHKSKTVKGG